MNDHVRNLYTYIKFWVFANVYILRVASVTTDTLNNDYKS